jgi:prevent-host-death family protein
MKQVNITELRTHLPAYLAKAQKGAEIWVTSHGEVIARVLPPLDTKATALAELKKLRKHCKIGDVLSPIDEDWDVLHDHS